MALVSLSAWPRVAVAAFPVLFALAALVGPARSARAQDIYNDVVPGYSMDTCESACSDCNSGGCGGAWIGAEWLLWRLDGSNDLPPLVTDGPLSDGTANAGRLDNPNTRVLFGNNQVGDDWRSGYRIMGGIWLDSCQCWGITGDWFNMCNDSDSYISPQDPTRIVTRPFFNTELGDDDTELVNVPNELSGTAHVSASDDFSGAGIALQKCLWRCCDPCGCGPSSQGYLLGGYRYYRYDSDLIITENLTVLPGTTTPLVPGTTIFVQDAFRTENTFNGGEIGFAGMVQQSCWWVDGLVKIAIGANRRTVTINGTTINNVPGGGTAQFEGGLLTSEATNIGRYSDTSVAVIPEFRLGVGTYVTNNLSVRAGYNVIIWDAVARAGDQLPPDLAVDPRNLPPVQPGGGLDPNFAGIFGSALIAHGFDFGVQLTF